jgi:hypothetical protein
MKNDFINAYTSLKQPEKTAFSQYIHYFFAANKTMLTVFDHLAAHKDLSSLAKFSHENKLNAVLDLKKSLIAFSH